MYLTNGTLLQGGKYEIERYISSGGFGCTYEGVHVLLKKRVAIKEFFIKDFCNRDEATATITVGATSKAALVQKLKAKFIEEAQAVSELKHSNIVNVYDVFEENGTAYYVMDYIDGSSLDEVIKVHGPLNEQKATDYILQVADALKYVHAKNRLHLDIKPGNIMVDKEGNAVLIDFGSSKQYDEESGENTSTLLGYSPGYAPPEQCAKNVTKFSPATDIYALGATFYKLLTGVKPLEMTLRASGEQLHPLPTTVSKNVRNAICRAMQMNKTERPQSVDEFVKGLKTGQSRENNPVEESQESTFAKGSLGFVKTVMGLLVVCGVLLIGAVAVDYWGSDGSRESSVSSHEDYWGDDVYVAEIHAPFLDCRSKSQTSETGALRDVIEVYQYKLLTLFAIGICFTCIGISGFYVCRQPRYRKKFNAFANHSNGLLRGLWGLYFIPLLGWWIFLLILPVSEPWWGFSYFAICLVYYVLSFIVLYGLYLISTQRRYGFILTLPAAPFLLLGMFLKRNGKSYWQYCKEVK